MIMHKITRTGWRWLALIGVGPACSSSHSACPAECLPVCSPAVAAGSRMKADLSATLGFAGSLLALKEAEEPSERPAA